MKLEFKTPEMGDPRGKPKVYFSCHPADREAYFETLTDEVLAHSTCAIWYDTGRLNCPLRWKSIFRSCRSWRSRGWSGISTKSAPRCSW